MHKNRHWISISEDLLGTTQPETNSYVLADYCIAAIYISTVYNPYIGNTKAGVRI